jgi:hypothetical protein
MGVEVEVEDDAGGGDGGAQGAGLGGLSLFSLVCLLEVTMFTTGSSVCKWPNQIGFESFVEIGAGEGRVCVCTRAHTRTTRTSGAGRSERG